MVVVLLPGAEPIALLDAFSELHRQARNQQLAAAEGIHDHVFDYLDWAGRAAHVLSRLISDADVDRLVLTRRHSMLIDAVSGLSPKIGDLRVEKIISDLVAVEVGERVSAFAHEVTTLENQLARWDPTNRYVMLDTNVYLEHRHYLYVPDDQPDRQELNFDQLLGGAEAPIRLLIPMVVIDELDAAKRFTDYRRGRATIALAVIDRVVRRSGQLRTRDVAAVGGTGPVPGAVTVDLLSEPRDHRLPNKDAEIVDCAVAIQTAIGTDVTLVTFGTGMALYAREAGLKDRLLTSTDLADDQQSAKKAKRGQQARGGNGDELPSAEGPRYGPPPAAAMPPAIAGTTGERPSPTDSALRYSSDSPSRLWFGK